MMRVDPIYITFLVYTGNYEYFFFTAQKEYQVDILESSEIKENVFPLWPSSWSETADTVSRTAFVRARNRIVVRSQYLTANQRDVLKMIKVSPVVQINVCKRYRS